MKKVLSIILTVVMLLGTLSTLSAMPAFAETADSGNAAWDGAGTAEDPYLITNRADLDALSDAVADGERFEGKYFKQTADITLGDTPFLSIGGYVYDALLSDSVGEADATLGTAVIAFSGTYDGQGYSIKDGTVQSRYADKASAYFASGFFGAIYDATIMNMVFDNVTFKHSDIINGNVVGIAATALHNASTAEAIADKNVVALVFVNSNCTATVTVPNTGSKLDYSSSQTRGITYGGIVGRAYSTTIRACKNGANATLPAGTISAGGIVGNVFLGASIDRCANTGNMTLSGVEADVVATWSDWMDRFFGGIVGAMASNVGIDADLLSGKGNFYVWECVNDGTLKIKSGSNLKPKADKSGSIIYGGIVGNTYSVKAGSRQYLIRDCYNLKSAAQASVIESGVTFHQYRAAGILGYAHTSGNLKGSMTVTVRDCYSVAGYSIVYTGTNEVHYHNTSLLDNNSDGTGETACATLSGANAVIKTDENTGSKYAHNSGKGTTSISITTLALDECIYSYKWNNDTSVYDLTRTETTLAQAAKAVVDTIDVEKYVEATKAAAKVCDHTDAQHTTEGGKPAGSGTKEDPYRITSVADLNWIAAGIKGGDLNDLYGREAIFGVSASYEGVYFEQVNDIVIGNTPISNIGYYYKNTHIEGDDSKNDATMYMAAFGGNYNGNGYSIKGGQIKSTNPGNGTNQAWVSGLFGVIYGATVKNIVIDNVDYNITKGFISGGIAGVSAAPLHGEGAGSMDFNVVENCAIFNSNIDPDINYNGSNSATTWIDGGVLGGIVGRSFGTTISGCYIDSTTDITAEFGCVSVGGIAGQVGSTKIVNCYNKGDIIITASNKALTRKGAELGFGGIVGHLLGYSNGTNHTALRNSMSGLLIKDCYFAGTIDDTNKIVSNTGTNHFGGILGGLNTPVYVAPTSDNLYPYLIENSHNLSVFTDKIYGGATRGGNRCAGIIGSAWCTGGADYSTIYVNNCYSVDVLQYHYRGTNEIRLQNNTSSSGTGAMRNVTVLGANGTGLVNESDASITYANFGATITAAENTKIKSDATKTADAIKVETAKIDAAIAQAHADGLTLRFVGKQDGNADETAGSYRFIFGVDSITQYNLVGVELYAFNANGDRSKAKVSTTTTLYSSILADSAVVTAEDLGCTYLSTLVIKNLADGTYSVKPFTAENEEGERSYGSEIKFTVTNGVIAAAN